MKIMDNISQSTGHSLLAKPLWRYSHLTGIVQGDKVNQKFFYQIIVMAAFIYK